MTPRNSLTRLLPGALWPATVTLIVLLVAPLLLLFSFGFLEVDRGVVSGGLTLETYRQVLGDSYFWYLFGRTFAIACAVTALCAVIGYPIAWLYTRCSGWRRLLILLAVASPLLTSVLVRTFAWIVLLGGRGGLNELLQSLGVIDSPLQLLFDVKGVIIGMTQILLPFMVVPLISAIGDVPRDTEHAARNLGASRWRILSRVIVPQTVPGIAAGCTLVFVLAYSEFSVAALLGGGSFNYASIYVYDAMTALLEWGRGAAVASLLLISSLLFITALTAWSRHMTRWARVTR